MYEEVEVVKESYLYLKDYIDTLNVSEFIKSELSNFNYKIYSWKKHKTDFKFNILIDNLPMETINVILTQIIEILKRYNICDEISEYSKHKNNYSLAIKENGVLIIDDYPYFENDILDFHRTMHNFFNKLNDKNCLLVIMYENDIQKSSEYNNLKKVFDIESNIRITGKNYTEKEILDKLKKRYKDSKITCNVESRKIENIIKKLLEDSKYSSSTLDKYLYDYTMKKKILNCYDEVNIECLPQISVCDNNLNINLDTLVGLNNIKKELKSLENFLNFRKKLKKDMEKVYLNMFFMGNPGTGKTTVARKCAEIFYTLGYIKENKVIEIIPTDLMANYVGQTKDKTREILNRAKGGVLFIDEAYLIIEAISGRVNYMNEALVELLKYLEDPTNVVIFAGYPNLMKKLYEVNPGLKSRIYKEIYFDDYTEEELIEITKRNLKKYGLSIDRKAILGLKRTFQKEISKKDFGNARFCEQYVQKIIINHANRVIDIDDYIINSEDVIYETKNDNIKIGFTKDGD